MTQKRWGLMVIRAGCSTFLLAALSTSSASAHETWSADPVTDTGNCATWSLLSTVQADIRGCPGTSSE
jgi:hypothetical protein